MKIAITGADGFIGSKILSRLSMYPQYHVVALTRNHDFKQSGPIEWHYTDYSVLSLSSILQGVDTIIHLAAKRGTEGTIADYHENELLTENILLTMGELRIKHIVFASSIAVYSDIQSIPWHEDVRLSPKTLYGISKASCEHLCMFYSKKFNYTYTIMRIAQVLGLEETHKGMMNNFIESAGHGRQLTVIGKSIAKRQFIYVDDLVTAMIICATQRRTRSEIMNIGMRHAYSNLMIAQIANHVFHNNTPINYQDGLIENIESSYMNVERLITNLQFVPRGMKESMLKLKEQLEYV